MTTPLSLDKILLKDDTHTSPAIRDLNAAVVGLQKDLDAVSETLDGVVGFCAEVVDALKQIKEEK